jgi:serine/threonine protein phosphatase PrpC
MASGEKSNGVAAVSEQADGRAHGRLALRSNGFWNYAPALHIIARLARHTPAVDPHGTAMHAVNFANVQGGHDNITAVVLGMSQVHRMILLLTLL